MRKGLDYERIQRLKSQQRRRREEARLDKEDKIGLLQRQQRQLKKGLLGKYPRFVDDNLREAKIRALKKQGKGRKPKSVKQKGKKEKVEELRNRGKGKKLGIDNFM